MTYYKYNVLWHNFFKELNIEIIEEYPDYDSITKGSKYLEPEACNHLKEYIGIVESLQNKCDYILVLDTKSVRKNETICPILANLTTIVNSIFPNLKTITYDIDVNSKKDELTGLIALGQKLDISYFEVIGAYRRAKLNEDLAYQNKYKTMKELIDSPHLKCLVVSHFYQTYRAYQELFTQQNITLINSDYLDYRYNNINDLRLTKHLQNTFLKELIKAIENNLEKIDGLILVEEENCFLTSITYEMLAKKINSIPVLIINSNNINITEIDKFIQKIKEKGECFET